MEMLVYNNYILKNPDRKKLKEYGFHYNRNMSDYEGDFYSIRFPVSEYLKSTTVEGEIIVDMETGDIRINAYNYGTKNCYPPFYQECSKVYKPIIEKINKVFNAMFNKIGIKKVGDK